MSSILSIVVLIFIICMSVCSGFKRVFLSKQFQKMALRDNSNEIETLVARCTRKISESVSPTQIKVTSSNDDPNGSHVSNCEC